MMRLIFKQRSKDDLLSIFDYIAKDNIDAALTLPGHERGQGNAGVTVRGKKTVNSHS